jgi:hypothetical protein
MTHAFCIAQSDYCVLHYNIMQTLARKILHHSIDLLHKSTTPCCKRQFSVIRCSRTQKYAALLSLKTVHWTVFLTLKLSKTTVFADGVATFARSLINRFCARSKAAPQNDAALNVGCHSADGVSRSAESIINRYLGSY